MLHFPTSTLIFIRSQQRVTETGAVSAKAGLRSKRLAECRCESLPRFAAVLQMRGSVQARPRQHPAGTMRQVRGPLSWTLLPPASTATTTGRFSTSNS